MSFGNENSASCNGLTVAQINQLDTTKMDFSEVIPNLVSETDVPNPSQTASHLFNQQLQNEEQIKETYQNAK